MGIHHIFFTAILNMVWTLMRKTKLLESRTSVASRLTGLRVGWDIVDLFIHIRKTLIFVTYNDVLFAVCSWLTQWQVWQMFFTALPAPTCRWLSTPSWGWSMSSLDVWIHLSENWLKRWALHLKNKQTQLLVIVRKHHINNVAILCAYPASGFEDNYTFFCCRTSVRWLQNFGRFLRRSLQLCLRNTLMTRALLHSGLKSNCCPSCLLYPSTSCPASAPRILPAQSFTPCESMCMSSMCECSL